MNRIIKPIFICLSLLLLATQNYTFASNYEIPKQLILTWISKQIDMLNNIDTISEMNNYLNSTSQIPKIVHHRSNEHYKDHYTNRVINKEETIETLKNIHNECNHDENIGNMVEENKARLIMEDCVLQILLYRNHLKQT